MRSSRRKPKTANNSVTARLRSALRLLLQAWDRALRSQRDVWECAVKGVDLRAAGLTATELRSLVTIGFVQHAVERTRAGAERRVFGRPGVRLDHPRTCVVLTETGALVARALAPEAVLQKAPRPFYDIKRGELWLGRQLVKRFKQSAPEQRTILSTFQKLHWPARIDDPLPSRLHGQPAKLRLRDAIKRLNQHQVHVLIGFRGDGSGRGIVWELASARNR